MMATTTASSSKHTGKKDQDVPLGTLGRFVCVPLVLGTIAFVVCASWYFVYLPFGVFDSLPKLMFVSLVHANLAYMLYIYYKVMHTDPGYVMSGWQPVDLEDRPEEYTPFSKEVSGPYWCSKCQFFRPLRSHHCRHCDKCVLVFDHHCPWVNNCVGWGNIKLFLLFLGYTLSWGCLTLAAFSYRILYIFYLYPEEAQLPVFWNNGLVLFGLMVVFVTLMFPVAGLFQHHCMLIAMNTTNPERKYLRPRALQAFRMPFPERTNLLQEHISLVMGPSRLAWLFPTPPPSDPYEYPSFHSQEELDLRDKKIEEQKEAAETREMAPLIDWMSQGRWEDGKEKEYETDTDHTALPHTDCKVEKRKGGKADQSMAFFEASSGHIAEAKSD